MRYWYLYIGILAIVSCQKPNESIVNTAHLDALYEDIRMPSGDTVGIIHIYSEAPDYRWVDDADEGTACVDDAARAAVFYLRDYQKNHTINSLKRARRLVSFLLNMQAENGFFYNFIWKDGSINTDFQTSVAEPNWWSWRAMWALSEALEYLPNNDVLQPYIKIVYTSIAKKTIEYTAQNFTDSIGWFEGIPVPTWLPYGTASDQAAIQVIGLLPYYEMTKDKNAAQCLRRLTIGILGMQIKNGKQFPHGAFLSWQNLWHAYGNSQAYALLRAGQVLQDSNLINNALQEINFYFAEIEKRGYRSEFKVRKTGEAVEVYDEKVFPQIAYGVRPMVWTCVEAYKISGEQKYLERAKALSQWFFGNNPAKIMMYDVKTGRCYDGIENADKINKNSGAESTIEALLTLQALEM